VRRRAIFECCKWDPQVGDTAVLADFAVVLAPQQWRELAALARTLHAETLSAEREILSRRDLLARLSLPRKIARVLQNAGGAHALAPPENTFRVMRFDFHPTRDGWRVTEVNSDVPGGYIEASGFSELMRDALTENSSTDEADRKKKNLTPFQQQKGSGFSFCGRLTLAGNPAEKIAACLRERLPAGGRIALVHATAYTDDRQVMIFLQRILERHGFDVTLASPAQIAWRDGAAFAAGASGEKNDPRMEKLDALFRFFPAEWLPNLDGAAWKNFFLPAKFPRTLLINPGAAMISQTKCFPLAWSGLAGGAPGVWSRLMPETRALDGAKCSPLARLFPARLPDAADWLLKPAIGRVGDGIGLAGVTREKDLAKIEKNCRHHPRRWVAQRKFESEPLSTPRGPAHICIGVYVINGAACGIYGRISPQPLINHLAQDVAVLLAPDIA